MRYHVTLIYSTNWHEICVLVSLWLTSLVITFCAYPWNFAELFYCLQGPKPEEKAAEVTGGSLNDAKPGSSSSSSSRMSTDKSRNYAVVAGAVTVLGALGWYLKSSGKKKPEEVHDWKLIYLDIGKGKCLNGH